MESRRYGDNSITSVFASSRGNDVAAGELNHQILLVHNFANIHPSMLIVAYPCSLYDRLLDNKRVEGKILWGRRYCYRQRAATMVRCCGQVSYHIVSFWSCVVVRGELERLDSTPLTGPLILPHVDWINRYAPMPCHHMKMVDIASASS